MFPDVISVAELNRLARNAIEREFPLLWVAGEVSNLARPASGHLYFTLKDDAAQVRCAMFRNRAQLLPWRLENGQQVEVRALVSLYEPRGDFQLSVEAVRQAGLGKLYEAFLRLKDKLAKEGLFDDGRKRPLPLFPRTIGVVTSPQAAALHDVLTALARRAPNVRIVVYPTLVQGKEAPGRIVAALTAAAQRHECEALLLVRGGGSLEDLWAFNDEAVARALAVMPMPVVTGVGHETDVTIADLAADRRAATPTAAAELASAGWFAAATRLAGLAEDLGRSGNRRLENLMQRLDALAPRLVHPAEHLARNRRQFEHLATRLAAATGQRLHRRQGELADLRWRLAWARPDVRRLASRMDGLATALAALSPEATLARGYAIARDEDGRIVRAGSQLRPASHLSLRFGTGGAEVVVSRIFPD